MSPSRDSCVFGQKLTEAGLEFDSISLASLHISAKLVKLPSPTISSFSDTTSPPPQFTRCHEEVECLPVDEGTCLGLLYAFLPKEPLLTWLMQQIQDLPRGRSAFLT